MSSEHRMNNAHEDLLFELGTAELPAGILRALSTQLAEKITALLKDGYEIEYGEVQSFATPRRLAVFIQAVQTERKARSIEINGPSYDIAFDPAGHRTTACIKFAERRPDVTIEPDAKNRSVRYLKQIDRADTASFLFDVIKQAIEMLTIPKPMRWGSETATFARPIEWIVLRFGKATIPGTLFGIDTQGETIGHRLHHPNPIPLRSPKDYAEQLSTVGYVIPNWNKRRAVIEDKIIQCAAEQGLVVHPDADLLDEITGLVEWPVALLGRIDPAFMHVPPEVLITTLKTHQRAFVVYNDANKIQPYFITVANLESTHPESVVAGNERVVRARLADAAFFYELDKKQPLMSRLEALRPIIFHAKLGSLFDRADRMSVLAAHIAELLALNTAEATRAALLSQCDLTTQLVGEFPELQGIMGADYAHHDKEPAVCVQAIREHILPRFSGDLLPQSLLGAVVALSLRITIVVGIFTIGQKPTGDKDPFGLRRAAIGIMRILIERELPLDLARLITLSYEQHQPIAQHAAIVTDVLGFIWDRYRAYAQEQGIPADVITAVLAQQPTIPVDVARRVFALTQFLQQPEVTALCAAHKRVNQILNKAEPITQPMKLAAITWVEPAEQLLAEKLVQETAIIQELCARSAYTDALLRMAALRPAIDNFFDTVMVMVPDPILRNHRLNLLHQLRELLSQVADLSCIQS